MTVFASRLLEESLRELAERDPSLTIRDASARLQASPDQVVVAIGRCVNLRLRGGRRGVPLTIAAPSDEEAARG